MGSDTQHGLPRREFLLRAGALGVSLGVSGNVLAACGSGSSESGSTLVVGAADWLPPDFYVENSVAAHLIGYSQMAWSLFMAGGGDGKGFEFGNGFASDYEVSSDLLTHTVTLKDGLTFHDGSPIDAEAIAANLRGSFFKDDPLHRGTATYGHVALTLGDPPIVRQVRVVDKRTVAVVLAEPRPDIKAAFAYILIMNPKTLRIKDYGTNVAALREGGSGPFRLTAFEAGDFAEFERFDAFSPGEAAVQRLRLRSITDPGTLAFALTGEEIHVASGLAKADWDDLLDSGYQSITSDPAANADFVFSYPKDPAFADRRVRQACALAMNREAYTARFFSTGTAEISSQPIIAPGLPGFIEGLEPVPYDPDAARSLMAEAGVTSAKLTLAGYSSLSPISSTKGLNEAIAGDLAEIGIDVQVEMVSPAAIDEAITVEDVDAFTTAPGHSLDPYVIFDLFVLYYYAPGALQSMPSVAKALERAHAATDLDVRDEELRKITKTIDDEALVIPISIVDYSAMAVSGVNDFMLSATRLDTWNKVSVDS